MCGIFGAVAQKPRKELVDLIYLGLLHVQHRGQDSAGIAYSDRTRVRVEKGMGLVSHVFHQELREKIRADEPLMLTGHVHYSTSGKSSIVNTQPYWLDALEGRQALCSDGGVPNLREQRASLEKNGVEFYTENDAEFLLKKINFLAHKEERNVWKGIAEMMRTTPATYSAALLVRDRLFLFRDPWGNRPLFLGKKEDFTVFASETCALDKIGARVLRSIKPGEIATLYPSGEIESQQIISYPRRAHCVFELIYFARPDSVVFGGEVGTFRYHLGKRLAHEHSVKADFVAAVPDSGNFAGAGFAKEIGIPFRILLVRNPYILRTFIMPSQEERSYLAEIKYSVMRAAFKKRKRLVLVDDSIVRGTTNRALIKMIREAGAEEIHLRISCPPIIGPCHYGIHTPKYEELVANKITRAGKPDIQGIADFLGVDSLGYLSLDGLKKTICEMHKTVDHFCLACFDRNYKVRAGF